MTDQEEIAIALLIYRNYRAKQIKTKKHEVIKRLTLIEKINGRVIKLAKKLGVKKEFFEFLFQFPVMTIEIKELDEWEIANPFDDTPTVSAKHIASPVKRSKKKPRHVVLPKRRLKQPPKPSKSSKQSQSASSKKPTSK